VALLQIQNVFELADGSALFVTVARYQTPARVDIDHVRRLTACLAGLLAHSVATSVGRCLDNGTRTGGYKVDAACGPAN
jgi:hypothetical protein